MRYVRVILKGTVIQGNAYMLQDIENSNLISNTAFTLSVIQKTVILYPSI